MTGISSSVGLISGIDYTSLVDQLIELDRQSIKNLESRTTVMTNTETALTNLSALFITSSYMIENLNKADAWNRCDVTSSNTSVLTATKNGTPIPGIYTFTPLQMASSQQTIAKGVTSDTAALGKSGTITIGKGWSLEKDIDLSNLNGGDGITKGYIRITDGSGTRATIDLRSCVTMNDVLKAINENQSIDISAELDGDKLVLTDLSGGDPSKVLVQEVSGGSTAASLGLTGATADENGVITGNSIYRLGENMLLSSLNDGNGMVFNNVLPDLTVTCKDGSTVTIDFNKRATTAEIEAGAPEIATELTLGDLIETINNSADANGNTGKIQARISDDGKGLVITDTTQKLIADPDDPDAQIPDPDAKTTITQPSSNMHPVLQTLGLISGLAGDSESISSSDGTFTTRQLIGDLDSPLMSSMNGGYGLSNATAGQIEVQDRSGKKGTISFTAEELQTMQNGSLNDAVSLLNRKLVSEVTFEGEGDDPPTTGGVGIEIRMNDKKTGLSLVDTTGHSSANLIFRDKTVSTTETTTDEDGEETTTTTTTDPKIAAAFGLNVDAAKTTANGESLKMQTVSYSTKLADLNGGNGVTLAGGRITITDSAGKSNFISIDSKTHQTLGDIINSINSLNGVSVRARLNDDGDGILLEDYANGTGSFSVLDGTSSSKICKELNISQTVSQAQKDEDGRMRINGSTTYSIEVTEKDTLDDIRKKINELGGNFSASVISDGSGSPYRLVISGSTTGAAGAMNIDLSCLGLTTENMTEAQDAVLVYGDASKNSGIVLKSHSNTFKNVVNGIDLTISGTSTSPVTVTSERSSVDVKASLTTFVENYNKYRESLNTYTYYSVTENKGNVLYNNSVARALDRDITNVLLKQIHGIPGINSLKSIGISIRSSVDDEDVNTSTGKLTFDEKAFDALWESNREGLQEFFFKEQTIFDANGEKDKDGNIKTTTIKTGWAQTFTDVANSIVGTKTDSGLLGREMETLATKIEQNTERAEFMEARLQVKKQQMLNKFYAMEQAMAQMSTDMSTVSSIASNWSSTASSGSAAAYYS